MNARLECLRAQLAAHGYDGFVSLSPPSNAYLAGFTGTASALVVTGREAYFLCDFRYIEQAGEQVTGYQVREMAGGLEKRAGELLAELGVSRAAYEDTAHTVWQLRQLALHYRGELVPDASVVRGLREVKDVDEVARIRAAAALTDDVLAEVVAGLAEGVTEREVAAQLEYGFKRRGAMGPSFDTIVLFGARSSLPHGMPGERALERGDIVMIDCGCRKAGYCADLTRTFAFATIPGAWFEEIYTLTLTAQQRALEAIRPGVPCREIDSIARGLISEGGYGDHFGHGLGHGVGLEIHEAPRLNQESETVLAPGMVVTVEPGIYLPGRGGVRIEDLVVVTETGYDLLSRSPKYVKR